MSRILSSEITLRVPLKREFGTGRFETRIITIIHPIGTAPSQEVNGARIAQKAAPFEKTALRVKANGASAPLSQPKRRDRGAFTLKGAVSADEYPAEKEVEIENRKSPHEELLLAREIISDLASDLAVLDNELAPVRAEEREIREEILSSHDETSIGVVVLDLTNRRERRKLFGRLDMLAEQWGKKKEQRRRLNSQVKSLEKQIQQLERIISKERKRA